MSQFTLFGLLTTGGKIIVKQDYYRVNTMAADTQAACVTRPSVAIVLSWYGNQVLVFIVINVDSKIIIENVTIFQFFHDKIQHKKFWQEHFTYMPSKIGICFKMYVYNYDL